MIQKGVAVLQTIPVCVFWAKLSSELWRSTHMTVWIMGMNIFSISTFLMEDKIPFCDFCFDHVCQSQRYSKVDRVFVTISPSRNSAGGRLATSIQGSHCVVRLDCVEQRSLRLLLHWICTQPVVETFMNCRWWIRVSWNDPLIFSCFINVCFRPWTPRRRSCSEI